MSTATALKHLLIVEDDPDDVRGYLTALAHPSVSMRVAQNGVEALAMARMTKPEVMLLDVRLPGMDGFEVFRVVRTDPVLKTIKVVFVTQFSETGALALAKDAGAAAWMRKPVTGEKLRAKVHAFLGIGDPGAISGPVSKPPSRPDSESSRFRRA